MSRKELKLDQNILVTSTSNYPKALIYLERASVYDIIDERVEMKPNGYWGHSPTRKLDCVFSNESEIETHLKEKFKNFIIEKDNYHSLGRHPSRLIFRLDFSSRDAIAVYVYIKTKTESSLRYGERDFYSYIYLGTSSGWKAYTPGYIYVKRGESLPPMYYKSFDEVIEKFKELISKMNS